MIGRRSAGIAALAALIMAALIETMVPSPAEAQYRYRAPRVYNPARYNNTRAMMNRRAAAQRSFCRHHPRAERCRKRRVRAR